MSYPNPHSRRAAVFGPSSAQHAALSSYFGIQPAAVRRLPAPARQDLVIALHDVARRISANDRSADAALEQLLRQIDYRIEDDQDGSNLDLYLFGAGMAARLSTARARQARTFLSQFQLPPLQWRQLLERTLPLQAPASRLLNDSLAQAITSHAHPCLIDIGTGNGRQMLELLDQLRRQNRMPRRMSIIGIDPDAQALEKAGQQLAFAAARVGCGLEFLPIGQAIEVLAESDWQQIAKVCADRRPVIHAHQALHLIADTADGCDRRLPVLRQLRQLNPLCLLMAEPDVNLLEPHYYLRFRQCFDYFGALMRLIDRQHIPEHERQALKVLHIGPQLADILGQPEGQRKLRYESSRQWLGRLAAAGFSPDTQAPNTVCLPAELSLNWPGHYLSLSDSSEGFSLLTLLAAVPRGL